MTEMYSSKEASFPRLSSKLTLPVFLMMVLLLLAACGNSGGTTSSSTPTSTTASNTAVTPTIVAATTPSVAITVSVTTSATCSLVTADQASKVLGGTVQTQSNSVTIGTTKADGCGYKSSQGGQASLSVVMATDASTAHTTFSQLQQATRLSGGSTYQDVSGIGDGAFTNGKVLYVLKGKSVMVITVIITDPTKALADEKQIAMDAVPKLS